MSKDPKKNIKNLGKGRNSDNPKQPDSPEIPPYAGKPSNVLHIFPVNIQKLLI